VQSLKMRSVANSKSRDRINLQGIQPDGDLTVYENVELAVTYRGMQSLRGRSWCRRPSTSGEAKHEALSSQYREDNSRE